ncbi:hypothetical protein HZ994_02550 [Akkermansiaceae bacterium]|nr:hypothetical protein HZ994_02550 [Akkermansiaceae bacterium]
MIAALRHGTLLLGATLCASGDTLVLKNTSGSPNTQVSADVGIVNERAIVGMQFDLKIPGSQALPGSASAGEGMERHRVDSRSVGNTLKIVIHSPTNALLPSADILSIPLNLSANSPEGGPSFAIENLIFTNAAGQRIAGAVYYHPLEVWRQDRFTEEQRSNPEIVGDSKDPDGDGYSNLMEFLFATNPLSPDGKNVAIQSLARRLETNGSGEPEPGAFVFSFDYPQAKDIEGVDLWIETSADLKLWKRETVAPVNAGSIDSLTDQMRLTVESDPVAAPVQFYRIGASRNPNAAPNIGVVPKVTFSQWLALSFDANQLLDPNTAGEQQDPDGDGMSNLLEYLLGSNPKATDSAALPKAGLIYNGNIRTAELKYGVSREAQGVALLIETSTNLQDWTPATTTTGFTGRSTSFSEEFSSKIDGNAPDQQFFRFGVVRE